MLVAEHVITLGQGHPSAQATEGMTTYEMPSTCLFVTGRTWQTSGQAHPAATTRSSQHRCSPPSGLAGHMPETVMTGDTKHTKRVHVSFMYQELSEDLVPLPGKPEPVTAPEEYARTRKWHVKRVFYFLICSSGLCLGAVALVPKPVVQGTALGIWAASVGLARYLLTGAYRTSAHEERPTG
jgi:hypothetical protein